MFIILLTYKKPLSEIDAHLAEHRAFLKDCYAKKALVVSGPQKPRAGGVLISQLKDKAAVEAMIHQDPFHRHDLADYDIVEFEAILHDPDFQKFIN